MSDRIKVQGIVLSAQPIGEHDKRLVIQTTTLGKVSAFARGCRRMGSPLLAVANPFVMGEFTLAAGRSSYSLTEGTVSNYFRDISALIPGVYMGFYFLDFVDYFGRENMDGTQMLNLLYVSLKALLNENIPDRLIRCIFELRLFAMNGVYAPQKERMEEELFRVCDSICRAPLQKLFSLRVPEELSETLFSYTEKVRRKVIDRPLKSAGIMESFYGNT